MWIAPRPQGTLHVQDRTVHFTRCEMKAQAGAVLELALWGDVGVLSPSQPAPCTRVGIPSITPGLPSCEGHV